MQRAAVLFDLDGTLTDPREGIVASLRYALEGLGAAPPPEAELARCIGPPLRETFARLLGEPGAAGVEEAVRLYRERFADRGLFENRVYPGIPELLRALAARGGRACVVTSKPLPFARRIVRHFGLEPALGAVYGSGLDGTLAHKPELVAHALAREALAPGSALMVGDRRHDVEGARACGVASIGVSWGYGGRAELEAAGASWICDGPDALEARLLDWLAARGRGARHTPPAMAHDSNEHRESERRRLRELPRRRPARIQAPGPGQESVWDYPRPPRVERERRRLRVELAGVAVAESDRALRVCETASPPTYYVPHEDVRWELCEPSPTRTHCEWKGAARYVSLRVGEREARDAAWTYPDPLPDYALLRDCLAFHAGRVDACWLGDERVRPQPGEFYGGWITRDLVGPFKGEPGSEGW